MTPAGWEPDDKPALDLVAEMLASAMAADPTRPDPTGKTWIYTPPEPPATPIGWLVPPRGTYNRAMAELQVALRRLGRVLRRRR